MPRPKIVPFGQYDSVFVIGNESLATVQIEYGKHILNGRSRTLIRLATAAFSALQKVESSAPSRSVLAEIKRLRDLVISLRSAFPVVEGPFERNELLATTVARYLAGWEFVAPGLWLTYFAELLYENEMIIDCILNRLDNDQTTRGIAWDLWIFHLQGILKEAGLPVTIRRDDLRVASDFVYFVDELQNQLPPDLNSLIKKRSLATLATAMKRAIDNLSGWEDVPIEIMIKFSLGALVPIDPGEGKIGFVPVPDKLKKIDELLKRANRTR